MEAPKIFESEYRFCLILWEHEPVPSGKLVELCREQLGWSKATTYTVIRRLTDRGIVQNENTMVSTLVTKEEVQRSRIDEMVKETFQGSVPAFIAAFTQGRKLTEEERAEILRMIDQTEEG